MYMYDFLYNTCIRYYNIVHIQFNPCLVRMFVCAFLRGKFLAHLVERFVNHKQQILKTMAVYYGCMLDMK